MVDTLNKVRPRLVNDLPLLSIYPHGGRKPWRVMADSSVILSLIVCKIEDNGWR